MGADIKIKSLGYNFIEELGKGGFGRVIKALSKSDNKYYAIKIIPIEGKSQEEIKKIQNESDILSKLNCENIVKYYDSDNDEKNFYILMEFCEGETLRNFIDRYKDRNTLIEENVFILYNKTNMYRYSRNA